LSENTRGKVVRFIEIACVVFGALLFITCGLWLWDISYRGSVDKDGIAYLGNGAYQIGGDAPESYKAKVIAILKSEPTKAQGLMAAAVGQCTKHPVYHQTIVPPLLAKVYKDFAFYVVHRDDGKSSTKQLSDYVFSKVVAVAKQHNDPERRDERKQAALSRMIIGYDNLNSCIFRKAAELAGQAGYVQHGSIL
jgi:hypothetical protein